MWGMHEGWGWWMLFGWLWFALFWGGIIALVVWAVDRLTRRPRPADDADARALAVAKERLARGEISKEEYEEIRRLILT
jgi:putative membrane protein